MATHLRLGVCALLLTALLAALPATAGAATKLELSPSHHDFDPTLVGERSSELTLALSNPGPDDVTLTTATLAGAHPGQFAITWSSCPPGLGAWQSCQLGVRMQPTQVGPLSATVAIANDGDVSPVTATLSGEGVALSLVPNATSHDFGMQHVDWGGNWWGGWVQNQSAATVQLGATVLDGSGAGAYWLGDDGCSFQTLGPWDTCYFQVVFDPSATITYDATLRVNSGPDEVAIALTGVGGAALPTAAPRALAFGDVAVGESRTASLTVRNDGNLPFLGIVAIPTGGDIGAFRVLSDGCSTLQLAAGATCQLVVRFSPLAAGPAQATLALIGDGMPTLVPMSGAGVQAVATIAPGGADFGTAAAGTLGELRSFAVANGGNAPLRVRGTTVTGSDASAFRVAGESCTEAPVAPGARCTIHVRFAPDVDGTAAAMLRVLTDDAAGTATAALTGRATTAIEPVAAGAAAVQLGWRAGQPAPFARGIIDLGVVRCKAAARCRVRVTGTVAVRTADGSRVVRLPARAWWPGEHGTRLRLALPARWASATPVLLAARLHTTARGLRSSTRTIVVPIVAGTRVGPLVVSGPAARQHGARIVLARLWCVGRQERCDALVTVGALPPARRQAKGPDALATVRASLARGASRTIAIAPPAGVRPGARLRVQIRVRCATTPKTSHIGTPSTREIRDLQVSCGLPGLDSNQQPFG